ncbi:MAG: hypothetical protein AAF664_13465 [Planctomycetota bacterium]
MPLRFLVAFAVCGILLGCNESQAATERLSDASIGGASSVEEVSIHLVSAPNCSLVATGEQNDSGQTSGRTPLSDSSTPESGAPSQVHATHLTHSVRIAWSARNVKDDVDGPTYLYAAYATNTPRLGQRISRSERDCFVIATRVGFVMRTSLNGLSHS